jgi:NADH-ubiquinone oxidoreductase chain 5
MFEVLFAMKISKLGRGIYIFLNRKWFFDKIYNEFISQFFLKVAYKNIYQNIDRGILEFLGPYGLSVQIYKLSKGFLQIPLNHIYHYLFLSLGFIILFVTGYSVMTFLVSSSVFMAIEFSEILIISLIFISLIFFQKKVINH